MSKTAEGEAYQMGVVGRKKEIKELERCDRSGKSELICIYGRRRVGKTYLVEQTFAGYMAFRAVGVENGNTRQQLKAFNMRLQEHGDEIKTIPRDWFEAFSRLGTILSKDDVQLSAHGKIIIFFDEFPWFATQRSDFLMAFGEFWNRCATAKGNYLFVICGSATSWIIGNVIENTGSLYNRVTCQIFLEPFTLRETELFLSDRGMEWSRWQIAEYQMIFGGLPFFMELLNKDESLRQNVDRLLFAPHAMLKSESKILLESTLKKSPVYGEILRYLSGYQYGTEKQRCYEALSAAKGTFIRAVDDLIKCGYIRQYKNARKSGHPLYIQLTDPFLIFHYAFSDMRGKKDVSSWEEYGRQEGSYKNWRGKAFEILCQQHTEHIKRALGISGVKTGIFPWVSARKKGGAQIDMVIERDDGITNLCEMKFTDKAFKISSAYEAELLKKIEVFREETKTKQTLRLVMISASGIAGVAHTEYISDVITLEDLFS